MELFEQKIERRVIERGITVFEQEVIAWTGRETLYDLGAVIAVEDAPCERGGIAVPATMLVVDIDDRNRSGSRFCNRLDHRPETLPERGEKPIAVVVLEVVDHIDDQQHICSTELE